MRPLSDTNCPVCGTGMKMRRDDYGDRAYFDCPRCGLFGLDRAAELELPSLLTDGRKAAVLSYGIKKTPRVSSDTNVFNAVMCKRIIDAGILPTPQEQGENLIRWLGDNLPGPGEKREVSFADHGEILGIQSLPGFLFVMSGLIESGLLAGPPGLGDKTALTLTFAGWERFEQLRRGTSSHRAFMAMQYGDPTLDRLVRDYFRVAVRETGFDLRRLDDEPRAGLIDDRLRVEIQSSRFLIVDLTHKNAGAYWEAGYAEGLGRPVIYTCEAAKFKEGASHFDTNHHLHVIWSESEIDIAMKNLKATIRATVPDAIRDN